MKITFRLLIIFTFLLLSSCGFRPQGAMKLAQPLHTMYLQTQDPYGSLAHSLEQYLKMSNVRLVTNQSDATAILVISDESVSQELLSVSGTQQTRQYNLALSVTFEVTDNKGKILIPSQTLIEKRGITIQSNQILGSSNEATLLYQQMRRAIAYSIMFRLSARDVTKALDATVPTIDAKKPT